MYIGSTTQSFRERWGEHYRLLKHNNHSNQHLQNAWNKYGENQFRFSILEIILKDDMQNILQQEQRYIDEFGVNNLYNICPKAGSTYGIKQSRKQTVQKSKHYIFISPRNTIYDVIGMRQFCRKHNIKQSHVIDVANNKLSNYKGWLVYNINDFSKERLMQDLINRFPNFYLLTDPNKKEYVVWDLKDFAQSHHLILSCLYNVVSHQGNRQQHKGWSIKKL